MTTARNASWVPVMIPARVVRSPATAVSAATPRAAPFSWPVIIRPDAMPDCAWGTSLIAATEIATNIGPTPRPRSAKPGSTPVR
jgi:hypothetical protein